MYKCDRILTPADRRDGCPVHHHHQQQQQQLQHDGTAEQHLLQCDGQKPEQVWMESLLPGPRVSNYGQS